MGYWKCPKCGSNDTYQGTEIVSEHKQGRSVGFENEFGVTVSQNVSGGTSHKQITVTKCRSCDILLGEQDYHLTTEEQQAQAEREGQALAKIKEFWEVAQQTTAHSLKYLIIAGIGFGVGAWIAYFLIEAEYGGIVYFGSCFVGQICAAGFFVLYENRRRKITIKRFMAYALLLLIQFGIIAIVSVTT